MNHIGKVPVEVSTDSDGACSISEFCELFDMSRTKFFELMRKKRGPRVMRDGAWIKISAEARREFRERLERPNNSELRLLEREKEALTRRARKAGQTSAKGPNHVSKRIRATAEA